LRCRHQLFSDEGAHLMAAAMFCLGAYLVEHVFEACLKSCTNFTHDVTRSLASWSVRQSLNFYDAPASTVEPVGGSAPRQVFVQRLQVGLQFLSAVGELPVRIPDEQ
jgi:hypothetical protein